MKKYILALLAILMSLPTVAQIIGHGATVNNRGVELRSGYYHFQADNKRSLTLSIANDRGVTASLSAAQAIVYVENMGDGTYVIYNERRTNCLDVHNSGYFNGNRVQAYSPNNTMAQRFCITLAGQTACRLECAENTHFSVQVSGGPIQGARLEVAETRSIPAQYWNIKEVEGRNETAGNREGYMDEYQEIFGTHRGSHSNHRDDYSSHRDDWGNHPAPSHRPGHHGDSRQIREGYYYVNSAINEDLHLALANPGAELRLTHNDDEAVYIVPTRNPGYYHVYRDNSFRCIMDLNNSETRSGNRVQGYAPNNTNAQLWEIRLNRDGSITIASSINRGYVLDVPNSRAFENQRVQLWDDNGTSAQAWYLEPIR